MQPNGLRPRLRYISVPIEQLVARGGGELGDGGGQFVVSRDQHDPAGELVTRRISRTYQRMAYVLRMLRLRDEHGHQQTLRVTEEHPFFRTGEGWTPARVPAAGDTILGADGPLAVVSNEAGQHPAGVAVYNLEVEQAHTYFVLADDAGDAGAVWVHNACELFDKSGIRYRGHFENRLTQRGGRGTTEQRALDAYRSGRLFYNPDTKNYIRHDSKTRVSVVVDKPTDGVAITVFEGNASPRWNHVRWRPGQSR